MTKMISLAFYLSLVAAGLYLNVWIFHPGAALQDLVAGIFLVLFGGYLFWLDFLSASREQSGTGTPASRTPGR